ncbi:hypothetical protein B0H21DRAFT_735653 [Amylocystis lapponica]|nr:hypothetical protein B0H21DRAFT_735653 [Amylocystis lapponica]
MSSTQTITGTTIQNEAPRLSLSVRASTIPLQPTGALDKYEHLELTPIIGREYPDVQLSDLLNAENSDELIRELAIIISQRNVTRELGLHVHPSTNPNSELGMEISVITSSRYGGAAEMSTFASKEWHSDITFEPIHTLPPTGGDTIFASSYEAYDRLSPRLTAIHNATQFKVSANATGHTLYDGIRGTREHRHRSRGVHPVIRTNPVTGWKGLFLTKRILDLTKDESDATLEYLNRVITENHDLQVRFKDDVAIWANSSTVHNVTRDYDEFRQGNRVVSLGERPYFDPTSKSRREALGLEKKICVPKAAGKPF